MSTGQWYRAVILDPDEITTVHVMGYQNGNPNGTLDANNDKISDPVSYVNIDMDFRNIKVSSDVVVAPRDSSSILVEDLGDTGYNLKSINISYNDQGTIKYKEGWHRTAVIGAHTSDHDRVSMKIRFNSATDKDGNDVTPTVTVWERNFPPLVAVSTWIYDMETGELVETSELKVGEWYTLVIENPINNPQSQYLLAPCNGVNGAIVDFDITDLQVIS